MLCIINLPSKILPCIKGGTYSDYVAKCLSIGCIAGWPAM